MHYTDYHSIRSMPNNHLTHLRTAIAKGRHITAYTDASFYSSKSIGAYGWVVGTHYQQRFTPLAHGAGWENGQNNYTRKMSSTRLEKIALLSASAFLSSMNATNATFHADNMSANLWFNNRNNLRHPLYEWHKRAHNDLDACMQHELQTGLPKSYEALHVRGHVEDRQADHKKWSMHEQGNHLADAIAEEAYSDGTHPLYTWKLPATARTTVTVNNNRVVDHVAHTVRAELSTNYRRAELLNHPKIWGRDLDAHDLKHLEPTGTHNLKSRATQLKFVAGMLATNTVRVQQKFPTHADQAAHAACRADGDTPPPAHMTDNTCTLCNSNTPQTNLHVFEECTHAPIVAARQEWSGNMANIIMSATTPPVQRDGEPPPKPQPTLNHDLAVAMQELWTLTATGTVPTDTWPVGKVHPRIANATNLSEDHMTLLRNISKVGPHAWWKGSFSTSMRPALEAGGLQGKKVNSVMASLRIQNEQGWRKVYDAYNTASAGTESAFTVQRALARTIANTEVDRRIADIYQRLTDQHATNAMPPTMTITIPIPLDTRLTHSLTSKTTWADTQERWLTRREASVARSVHKGQRAAIAVDIHEQFAARDRPPARKTKQPTLFANFLQHPSTVVDDEPHSPRTRTPAAQARHKRRHNVLPDSESDTETEPTLHPHNSLEAQVLTNMAFDASDSPPAPIAPPTHPDPPNQDAGRGRSKKRLLRAADANERRERKQQQRQERQREHDEKIIQQAEAKTAQALEGVERRARKRAHDAEHGEKEQSNKRTKRAKSSDSGTNSRRSSGAGSQRDAEEDAGGRDGHTAGHRTNGFGDG